MYYNKLDHVTRGASSHMKPRRDVEQDMETRGAPVTDARPAPAPVERTARSTVRRRAGRGSYDRAVIEAILDEGLVGHVGICDADGQPYVIPVIYARSGDQILLHGSPLSRLLTELSSGVRACFTVTLLDGIVMARSAFHHSVNFRSVVVLGEARLVTGEREQHEALRAIVEHVVAGRSDDARGPSAQELAATEVVAMPLREASAKIRTGPPIDAAEDQALPVWAGVIPLELHAGAPINDPLCKLAPPAYAERYSRHVLTPSP
jgi:nitroimidazol reductase NimA-like FMN-containing flavoprotein (pyridoxamine 5'-phosphate oxidase superfamily)